MSDDAEIRAKQRVGSLLNDKWTLERLLGVGGMAAVYAARHRNGARAAVKLLHAELSRHAEVRERFRREGYAANSVEHPGVVKVLDDDVISSGPEAGTAYLVMELLEGQSLQDRLEAGHPMGEREFLELASSVLDVLEAAHARGVVHRDLKPENLFLLEEPQGPERARPPRIKVLDFGLARLLQEQAITSYGLALGTPSFMSPEQAAGRIDEIDGRTDLFALAATGFRLRTGRRIHEGANPVELVTRMANVAAPRIRTVAPDVSEPFARIIDRGLEFRREDRYENAAAMRWDVGVAIAELDAATDATRVSGHKPARPAVHAEPTVELSRRDFEPSQSAQDERTTKGARPLELWPQAAVSGGLPEESIHIPRRRSVLPWLALLALGGVGAKFWLNSRHTEASKQQSERPAESAVAPALVVASASLPVSDLRDAGTESPHRAPHGLAPSASPIQSLPSLRSAPATTPHAAPRTLGPGNVHKLSGAHHAR